MERQKESDIREAGEGRATPVLKSVRRGRGEVPLSDQAYQILEEKIVTNEFSPGKVLSEGLLATQLGMGRTPVREALQRLANEGLVQILPQRGILVSDLTVDDYLKLMEARRPLERLIAELAAVRASQKQNFTISKQASQFRQAQQSGNERLFMKVDHEFNHSLIEAADNNYVSRMVGLLHGQSRRFYFKHHAVTDFSETARLHADLAEAVANRREDNAIVAADRLIDFNVRLANRVLNRR
ncbi:GntR family transcriptional regulator [Mesorhizobium sp. M1A.F.Ca.IN.022.07.1.1]|uniref:GntR family transcriptional regulator n=1 Tax=unclassified Mesorhizobium TaxID=325217 RepID=UPI000FCCBEB4|nr:MULTISPECIES: GntR family transcriptional regulator [unclassified Mesorhizobium]RUV95200.1 GntR family transcriptional regulator [Mesorhizobium sp. M1A.F.Ca.IN.022.07.1.1]RWM65126.1 MAG: GntR family transcriptional regulator [Mesorhizobium sp.]RWM89588.1 MAG: GntR family transcriptional regulator [Mesorhizobium sp.]TJV54606.1 MAG: GntR family transcriptional regulator [Mesorhizobium sp.]